MPQTRSERPDPMPSTREMATSIRLVKIELGSQVELAGFVFLLLAGNVHAQIEGGIYTRPVCRLYDMGSQFFPPKRFGQTFLAHF